MGIADAVAASTRGALLALGRPAALHRDGQATPIIVSAVERKQPGRGLENGRPRDAALKVSTGQTVEPRQNDEIEVGDARWIVWNMDLSPAGSHVTANCVRPPDVPADPVREARESDGGGGSTYGITEADPAQRFLISLSNVRANDMATATSDEVLRRAVGRWQTAQAPVDLDTSWLLIVRGITYRIESLAMDDENDAWSRAILARVGA